MKQLKYGRLIILIVVVIVIPVGYIAYNALGIKFSEL